MAVSILMGVFEICFLFYERVRETLFDRKSKQMAIVLGEEITTNADFPTEEHRQSIYEMMKRLSGLESFDLTMDRLEQTDGEKSSRYLLGIAIVFDRLARFYSHKNDLHRAYFCYIVRRWYRLYPTSAEMLAMLAGCVQEGSLYARQNALEALARVGTAHSLVEGLISLETHVDFHHPKLITEIAMTFRGNTEELVRELENNFRKFRPDMQTAIINFIRMRGYGNPELYLLLLQDEDENSEVRLACMRYFMRFPDARVAPILRTMTLNEDPGQWEYAAVAATVLGNYIDDDTLDVLVTSLSSPLWYVRYNAAKTLYEAGLMMDGPRLKPLMESGDRYAQEMLRYRWEIEGKLTEIPGRESSKTP